MIQTQENSQKAHSGPNLGRLDPNSRRHLFCFVLLFFFFKNLPLSVTRYHFQLSSCTISEKTNLKKI